MGEARLLAGFVQSTLDSVDGLGPTLAGRVRARMRPESLAAIRGASRIGWVPLVLDAELTEALFAEAGPERTRELMRRNLLSSFDAPILRPLIEGAVRLLGRDPERLLRWAPKVWSALFRDAGVLHFVPTGEGTARIELSELAPAVVASEPWLDGTGAAISAAFDLLGCDGSVRLEPPDRTQRRATFTLRWKRAS